MQFNVPPLIKAAPSHLPEFPRAAQQTDFPDCCGLPSGKPSPSSPLKMSHAHRSFSSICHSRVTKGTAGVLPPLRVPDHPYPSPGETVSPPANHLSEGAELRASLRDAT